MDLRKYGFTTGGAPDKKEKKRIRNKRKEERI